MDKIFITSPGMVGPVPATIWLLYGVLSFAVIQRVLKGKSLINEYVFYFLVGITIPILDDLSTWLIGSPFSHHSIFHSFLGIIIVFLVTRFLLQPRHLIYLTLGHLLHILFNFTFDFAPLLFPFSIYELSISQFFPISSAEIKIIGYPIILLLFFRAIYKFLINAGVKPQS